MFRKLGLAVPRKSTFFKKIDSLQDRGITAENGRTKVEEIYYADFLLPRIREERFKPLYDKSRGAPNVPVPYLVGILMYARDHGLTDEKVLGEVREGGHICRALCIPRKWRNRICMRTLTYFRKRVRLYEEETETNLLKEELCFLDHEEARFFEVDCTEARQDSMMVDHKGRKMSDHELVLAVLEQTAQLISDHEDDPTPINMKEDEHTRLQRAAAQRDFIVEKVPEATHTQEFRNLDRVVREQLVKEADGSYTVIEKKERPSNRLRHPLDTDATVRVKRNTVYWGRVLDVVEVRDKEKAISMIYRHDLEPNTYSDAQFGEDFVDCYEPSGLSGADIQFNVTDAAYFRLKTIEKALDKGIDYWTTGIPGKKPMLDRTPRTDEGTMKARIRKAIEKNHDKLVRLRSGVEGVMKQLRDLGVARYTAFGRFFADTWTALTVKAYNTNQMIGYLKNRALYANSS